MNRKLKRRKIAVIVLNVVIILGILGMFAVMLLSNDSLKNMF